MIIDYGKHYKNSEKNVKKKNNELHMLEKIKTHIKQCNDYIELKNNPISKMYGFERLRHELNNYYSFNLCKNGGTARLIISINELEHIVILEYISVDHYADFKNKL
jgi:hypothetical protein